MNHQDTELAAAFQQALQHQQAGRLDIAETLYRRILAVRPHHPDTLCLLGSVRHQLGDPREGVRLIRQAIRHRPDKAAYHHQLALALFDLGNLSEAARALEQAIRLDDSNAVAYNDLGVVLKNQGDYERAIACYEAALHRSPDYADAHFNLGNAHKDLKRFSLAIDCYRKALACKADESDYMNNLGYALEATGNAREALSCYRQALRLRPDFMVAHSNLLYTLSYNVLLPPDEMLAAHREWDQKFGGPDKARTFTHQPDPDPNRKLRIGYLSPDFRQHAVSFFFEPLLKAHNPDQVEIFCYAELDKPDHVTQRLQSLAHHWRSTTGLADLDAARMIHDDQIDILVDLAGHTAGNRLGIFTYKPAPIQATYLGYFTTTGLTAMDYWISDAVLHPQDSPERSTEQILRLPRCCLAYQPPPEAPEPASPTHQSVVFASFNQLTKTSPQAIALWARVLHAVSDSRLLIKNRQLHDPDLRQRLIRQFAGHGITPQRLELRPTTPDLASHLATYNEVDIALDTVPRTGGTTTAEALWMGVPVVTLAGDRFIERLSASMISAVGLTELIASSSEEFVEIAVQLARDIRRRRELRHTLRRQMAQSPLCNGPRLANNMEQAFRKMWQNYLMRNDSRPGGSLPGAAPTGGGRVG